MNLGYNILSVFCIVSFKKPVGIPPDEKAIDGKQRLVHAVSLSNPTVGQCHGAKHHAEVNYNKDRVRRISEAKKR
jgi:hypothetical protein